MKKKANINNESVSKANESNINLANIENNQ
jgi:hypothetical protein